MLWRVALGGCRGPRPPTVWHCTNRVSALRTELSCRRNLAPAIWHVRGNGAAHSSQNFARSDCSAHISNTSWYVAVRGNYRVNVLGSVIPAIAGNKTYVRSPARCEMQTMTLVATVSLRREWPRQSARSPDSSSRRHSARTPNDPALRVSSLKDMIPFRPTRGCRQAAKSRVARVNFANKSRIANSNFAVALLRQGLSTKLLQ